MNENYIPKESIILGSQERQLLLARKLEGVYKNRPDIGSFVGAMSGTKHENKYYKEAIEKDKLYAKQRRAQIDESNSSFGQQKLDQLESGFQLSEILQAMIVDLLNNKWFKDCEAIMTSDFDDLTVGIDAIMKHQKGGHYLGIAFDFTVTNQDKIVYDKLKREWDKNIVEGKIPVVKYFEDPNTKQKGRLSVPKFIIGASRKDVEELAEAYLTNNNELLENHPFKYLILLQIEEQLQTVLDYYETNNENKAFQFAKLQYERIQILLRNMKKEIHADEKMHENVDLYGYTKSSVALDMMRRFRIMREKDSFQKIPVKERMVFQVFLMQSMFGEKPLGKTDEEWEKEKIKWIEMYAKTVGDIIDNAENKEIRDLIMQKKYEEASNFIIKRLKPEDVAIAA